ncbi:PREDICTED: alpha-tocopherol transfer protein-like [Wasmannia auropunctata]|uniref:alpha-tocopherol transfer protein-like n=1 Tax=Wasmannia auropunctata TaxID=64793 RepID=UPI0005EDDCBE|nr:PREDICTED: alpha-tocopherol transfer protein-like [Wasmannia auropunctata]
MENERNYGESVIHGVQELTSEDKKYAAEHLNETDENREDAIAKIRCWTENELCIRTDNYLILQFLRVCKFNLEKTKNRMQNYYKQRSALPDWYMNKDPFQPELQEMLDMGVCLPLRKLDSQGRLVFIVRLFQHDPTIHKLTDLIKVFMALLDLTMRNNATASIYGFALYVDMTNPTVRHISQISPLLIWNGIHALQSCFPIRMGSLNYCNTPPIVNGIIKIARACMTEKLKKRFHVYPHMLRSCFKDIPSDILPIEYGGTDGTIQELTDYWKKLVENNRDWIMSNENNQIYTLHTNTLHTNNIFEQ